MAFDTTHDIVPDSPTNVFATLNPLFVGYAGRNNYVSNNGNLQIKDNQLAQSTFTIPEDGRSYYMEAFVDLATNDGELFIRNQLTTAWSYNSSASQSIGLYYSSGSGGFTGGFVPRENGVIKSPITIIGTLHSNSWDLYPYEVVFGVLVSKTNRTLSVQFYANNTLVYQNNSFNFNDDAPAVIAFAGSNPPSGKFSVINFGQDHTFGGTKSGGGAYPDSLGIGEFYYDPPTGALALCTANLPDPAIDPNVDDLPSDYMKAVVYDGSTSSKTIDVGFTPDLVWIKGRNSSAIQHNLFDSVRTLGSSLLSNSSVSEQAPNGFTSFDSTANGDSVNGFTLPVFADTNSTSYGTKYVAWCWRAAGSPTDNQARIIDTNGSLITKSTADLKNETGASITPSKVSANRKSGFSIIKYQGTSNTNEVPHGLSQAPELIIIKNLDYASGWVVGSEYLSSWGYALDLSVPLGEFTASASFNSIAPASNVFSLGSSTGANNSSYNYIAYCWHSVEGYSAFGSYTGNGSADGPFVYTGFKPAWLMVKNIDGSEVWQIWDNKRGGYNGQNYRLFPNESYAESQDLNPNEVDLLSSGFKMRHTNSGNNGNNQRMIFMAFAEQPTKYATAR